MKSALSLLLLLYSLHVASQSYTELADSLVHFSSSKSKPEKIKALNSSDSSWLPAGYYKLLSKGADRSFQVGDSGLLQGSFLLCYSAKNCMETVYEKGAQVHVYMKSGKLLLEESYDSTVSVLQYNSKKNKWEPQLKSVIVDKTYDPAGRLSMLRYAKSPYDAYATYKYTRGVLINENIPFYQDKKWSPYGGLYEQTNYNWTLRQIEITTFKKGILYQKMVVKNSSDRWKPEGVISYATDPSAPVTSTTYTYAEGTRVVKKEQEEATKRIVTVYNEKGKVVSVNVYPISRDKIGLDIVAPREEKQ